MELWNCASEGYVRLVWQRKLIWFFIYGNNQKTGLKLESKLKDPGKRWKGEGEKAQEREQKQSKHHICIRKETDGETHSFIQLI